MATSLISLPERAAMMILTASSGLGTYVPAVQLYHELSRGQQPAGMTVLESLYCDDKLAQLVAFRSRFQREFRYALAAKGFLKLHSMADNLCPDKCAKLVADWKQAGERRFMVFSGFWLPLLCHYRERLGKEISVSCVQLEAVISPSWRSHLDDYPYDLEIVWLYSSQDERLVQMLVPPHADVVRADQLVVHGGGWHIGDYADTVDALATAGYTLLAGRPDTTPATRNAAVAHFCVAGLGNLARSCRRLSAHATQMLHRLRAGGRRRQPLATPANRRQPRDRQQTGRRHTARLAHRRDTARLRHPLWRDRGRKRPPVAKTWFCHQFRRLESFGLRSADTSRYWSAPADGAR
jgi:hypothetical protein